MSGDADSITETHASGTPSTPTTPDNAAARRTGVPLAVEGESASGTTSTPSTLGMNSAVSACNADTSSPKKDTPKKDSTFFMHDKNDKSLLGENTPGKRKTTSDAWKSIKRLKGEAKTFYYKNTLTCM